MTKEVIKINGVDCTTGLTTYKVNRYDLHTSDSGTSISGKKVVRYVRPKEFKITLGWTNITTEEKNYILDCIESGNAIKCDFAWKSNTELTSIKATYRGDIEADMKVNNGVDRRWDLSFALIEI